MIELQISGLPKTPNELKKLHHMARYREAKKWRATACWTALKHKPKHPFKQVELTFVRCSSKQCDLDNGIASVKPIIDGLVDAKLFTDDNPSIVKEIHFGWEPAPPNKGFIKIIIVPL